MADLLDIRNLRIEATVYPPGEKPRDAVLVDGVSLSLKTGRVLGLIGESGAGKSTIGLSSMAYGRGGVRLTGGEIVLNGRDIRKLGPAGLRGLRGKEVTYVAQSAAAAFTAKLRGGADFRIISRIHDHRDPLTRGRGDARFRRLA